jgi:hypothetical protein
MLVEDIIFEANVEPEALAWIDNYVKELKPFLQDENPDINHDAFLKRLRLDIINNKEILPHGYLQGVSALQPYEPKETDPDYIKNATDPIYTIRKDWFEELDQVLQDIFSSGKQDQLPAGKFYKFHDLITSPDLDLSIKNKLDSIKKKYELRGSFDLRGLKDAMKVMDDLGSQRWKHDKVERQRVETEAPIIMKFKNGYMWVRLDSKEEMQREGDMMQNCISGYCPVGQEADLTLGLRDEFVDEYEPGEQTDDTVYEFLEQWLEENDTTIQDYLMDKLEDEEEMDHQIWDDVMQMNDEEALDWMAHQIIEADADIETGESPGGHLIYSLRDKHGESHVSAEYEPNHPDKPTSALGKQNKEALDKYKPYIKALNNFFEEHPETFGPKGNTKDMPFHPDYDDDRERDEPTEAVNEGDLIPNPANTVAIKTKSDGDFYNLSKYMGDLDKATKSEFGSPDSAAVITFQDKEEAEFVLNRIKKHTGLKGDNVSGYEDPGDPGTWNDEEGGKEEEKPLSLLGHELKRIKHLAGI